MAISDRTEYEWNMLYGMIEDAWTPDNELKFKQMEKVEQIAKTAHEVNRVWCELNGDMSHPSWEDAPGWQRESAINGVEFHLGGDYTPEQAHENWVFEKEENGWIYGGKKDAEAKTHPCLVEYGELPFHQRAKDSLFIAVVHSFKA